MSFAVGALYVALGGLANILIGVLWYSPLLFSRPWMASLGLKEGDIRDSGVTAMPGYLASTAFAVAQAYGLGFLVLNLQPAGFGGVLALALGVWLVTSGLANLRIKFFEDRPWALYFIDEGYAVVVHAVLAVLAWVFIPGRG